MAEVAAVLDVEVDVDQSLTPLPGGEEHDLAGLMQQISARYGVDAQAARRLMRLYGSEVFTVLGDRPTAITGAVFAEEITWAVEQESALSLEDVVYRRLRIPWFRPEETAAVAAAAVDMLAAEFSWSPAARQQNLDELLGRVGADLAFREAS